MTIHQAYQQLLAQLYAMYEHREAANIGNWVIEHVTGQTKIERIVYKDLPVSNEQLFLLQRITNELLEHKPVQYVLNEAWFAGMKFYVDENVLIPRPETEELVQWMVEENAKARSQRSNNIEHSTFNIIDIGTGSGCIPIALKKNLPDANVSAVDVSVGALMVAKQNAGAQHTAIHFMQLDFLDETQWVLLNHYDIVVSNPPYIKQSEDNIMSKNVLKYEPRNALFVPDEDALVFYKALAKFGSQHLVAGGSIYMEINEALGKNVTELFTLEGYSNVTLRKDMQGKDRMVKANWNDATYGL